MHSSKIICDDTYSNKPWCIASQGKACLRSARSTRWSERCAPTWIGSSTSTSLCSAIFNIAFSKIFPNPNLIPPWSSLNRRWHHSRARVQATQALVPVPRCLCSHPAFRCPRVLRSSRVHLFLHTPRPPMPKRPYTWPRPHSFSKHWVRCRTSMPCPGRHRCLSLVCPYLASCFHPNPPALDALTNDGYRRSSPVGARIRLPFLPPPCRPRPRWGKPPIYTVTEELGTCSLTAAFLFPVLPSISSISALPDLIQAFLRTCVSFPVLDTERTRHEARFAASPELAMCLRRGLARALRVSGSNAVRLPVLEYVRRAE